MRSLVLILLSVIVQFCTMGCAKAVSPSREAYILAHPHGWVEISLVDNNIPLVSPHPNPEKKKQVEPYKPTSCRFEIRLDEERFVREDVYPVGDAPPFQLDTGFRFAAPVGYGELWVSYSGCDVGEPDGYVTSTSASTQVILQDGSVTPVLFDGGSLAPASLEVNRVVTLTDIDDRLKGIESALGVSKGR